MRDTLEEFKNRILNPTAEERRKAGYSLALFSANIKRFLPSVSSDNYEEMYKKVIYYQKKSGIEQSDLGYLRKTEIRNRTSIQLESGVTKENTIFATFHLGSYRLMNSYLYEQGYKVVLIIDDSVFNKQQEEMLRVCREVLKGKPTSDMVILNIKDRKSIFKLKHLIEEGYVMTVYLDGNSAMVEKSQDFAKSFISIDFLESEMYVKNGVGKLAVLLQAQIVPVVSFRNESDVNIIEFHEEIKSSYFDSKNDFAVQSIEIAYRKLEEKLVAFPEQWECWLYIHKWFMRDSFSSYTNEVNVKGYFNKERYTTFFLGSTVFLFDLFDYQSYSIDGELYNAINLNDFKSLTPDLLVELKEKNIIV